MALLHPGIATGTGGSPSTPLARSANTSGKGLSIPGHRVHIIVAPILGVPPARSITWGRNEYHDIETTSINAIAMISGRDRSSHAAPSTMNGIRHASSHNA